VKEARVDADNQRVEVIYEKDKIERDKVISQIRELGLKGDMKLITRAFRHLFHQIFKPKAVKFPGGDKIHS